MPNMSSEEIRDKFLKFFESRGHKILTSSSLVPEGDSSVLFTTAGMQQFKPYYTGEKDAEQDFETKNIVTIQKCVRTGDIDEVGDGTHVTFFEMLGNFSFGGYGKKEAIEYAHEFITKELGLSISYVTVFGGGIGLAEDKESIEIWKSLHVKEKEIIKQGIDDVFWGPTGNSGPCGPTTEIYCKNANDEDVEIWNIVFNEYFSRISREEAYKSSWQLENLKTVGIDTGMGLERLLATVENKKSIYDTDLFVPAIEIIKNKSKSYDEKSARIVADHFRTALLMASDGVIPSNKDGGYVMRRLIRRAWTHVKVKLGTTIVVEDLVDLLDYYVSLYEGIYPNIFLIKNNKYQVILDELNKFDKTLELGLKEFEKGIDPFILATTYGFPIELTIELAKEKNIEINLNDFNKKMAEHQKLSQTASAGMFKGGLANHNEKTIKLHTAHHLLLAALQAIVNPNIKQRGSNITEERLRIDFLCDHKLTDEEKKKVEDWVNDKILKGFDVTHKEMPLVEAEKIGAQMEFGTKYPDMVSIYMIEDKNGNFISKEFCGGPHVTNTSELGHFKIQKEEAVAQGIRRIKAILS